MTRRMIWDDHYKIGVDQLDRQHEMLFGLYNDCLEARASGSEDAASHAITRLEDYAASHFQGEEALMVGIRYPHYTSHKMDHESFLVELHQLKLALQAGDDVFDRLCRFFRDWLISHIAIRDQGIAAHLHDQAAGAE